MLQTKRQIVYCVLKGILDKKYEKKEFYME